MFYCVSYGEVVDKRRPCQLFFTFSYNIYIYHTYLERRFSRWSNSCMVNVSIIQAGIICKHSSHVMCSSHQFAHSSCLAQPYIIIIFMLPKQLKTEVVYRINTGITSLENNNIMTYFFLYRSDLDRQKYSSENRFVCHQLI